MWVIGGGDVNGVVYIGYIEFFGGLIFIGYSIENSDLFDDSIVDLLIYEFKVWNGGVDGVDFIFVVDVCLIMILFFLFIYMG